MRSRRELRALLTETVTAVLTAAGKDVPFRMPASATFVSLGVDSLAGIAVAERLGERLGSPLPATSCFDHPTVGALLSALAGDVSAVEDVLGARSDEPIAIVSMACRYPGGITDPEGLWHVVRDEVDAVGDLPGNRGWDLDRLVSDDPDQPGTTYAAQGGFLYDADQFDPAFFGISPREATAMDPQQRLLLETAWELFERAGIAPALVRGPRTGVFVGAEPQEYGPRLQDAPDGLDGHLLTGNATSVVSGRIAYVLGLEGPTLTVDTACSGSLVALHLAVQALRNGECDVALGGGVSIMASPGTFTAFSRQRGLSRDGRCKAFAAAADGTAWGEGAGLLLLERLSDAVRRGHQVLGVIRGSAINSDGASNGLTAPNGPSQQRVIRAALAASGLAPRDVDAVEAHGTGTPLGDPIEAQAIIATYGQDRGEPLYLGSFKSNVGHTQAAAGVGGVIKMVEAMRHGMLPRTLHVDEPSPRIDWAAGSVELLTEARSWPDTGRPRRSAVSSFGISGTNAHLVLEAAPPATPVEAVEADPSAPLPWLLSARSADALHAAAADLAGYAETTDADDVAIAAALLARTGFEHRAVITGADRAARLGALSALADASTADGVVTGTAVEGEFAVLFTGQGSQRVDMGRELYEIAPVFRAAFDEVCSHLDLHLDVPLQHAIADADLLARTEYTQPALFAIEVALYRLVESWGVVPDAVGGHSVGEFAAAHVAGVLSLSDASLAIAHRGRLMQALPAGGVMIALQASEDDVRVAIGDVEVVDIAAVNGPHAVVIAGTAEACRAVAQGFERSTELAVSHAFHSALMAPMLEDFADVVDLLAFSPPSIPMVSALTGAFVDDEVTRPEYWVRHVRETVRFADAFAALAADGVSTVLELGPAAVLTALAAQGAADPDTLVVPALRKDRPELSTLHAAVAELMARGVEVDADALVPSPGAVPTDLPTYPFQRERFWLDAQGAAADATGLGLLTAPHTLLPAGTELAGSHGSLLTGALSVRSHPWLADHVIGGRILFPGTGFVELALEAAEWADCDTLEELTLAAPLVLTADATVAIQVEIGPADADRRSVDVYSRTGAAWQHHASGVLLRANAPIMPTLSWPPADAQPFDLDGVYATLAEQGYGYGPAFRGLRSVWHRGDEVFAEVALPESITADGVRLHPALLDAALQALDLTVSQDTPEVPFAWTDVTLLADGARTVLVHARPGADGARTLTLHDPDGTPVAVVGGIASRPISADDTPRMSAGSLYEIEWIPAAAASATPRVVGLTGVDDLPTVVADVLAGGSIPDFVAVPVDSAESALGAVQTFLAEPALTAADLVLVVAARPGAVRGLARAAQAEHPGRVVLLDTDGTVDTAAALATGEPEISVRDGAVFVPRLRTVSAEGVEAWRPGGTVLVTGGTGGLGLRVAHHLADRVDELVLVSRRGPDAAGIDTARAELEAAGARVEVVACDLGNRDAVAALCSGRRFSAVVHAAGILDDALIADQSADRLRAVAAPKSDAARWLDEFAGDVDAFVLFSSAAATLDGTGQANYAAANADLEALATERRAAGRPATAVGWTLWDEPTGMAGQLSPADLARIAASGLPAMDPVSGLALLDAAVTGGHTAILAIVLDARTAKDRPDGVPHMLRGLVRAPLRRAAAAASVATLTPEQVVALVREHVAASLGHGDVRAVDPDRAFTALGLDSLAAIDLRNRLNAATGLRLPATLVFDHPNTAALASHIGERLGATPAAASPIALVPVAAAADDDDDDDDDDDPIVVVGMACHYPGGVDSADDLWRMVVEGRDGITEFPADRGWDVENLYDPEPGIVDRSYTKHGGFLHEAAQFDADFFGISPREALAMDPQQRLLLETTWELFEDAGIDIESLRGSRTGVFAGVMYHDFAARLRNVPDEYKGYLGNGSLGSVVSGRISYTFGFEGPALTIDTACSSSLVALHLAAESVRAGECDRAVAGGVTVMTTPDTFTDFSLQRGLAADGRCKAFAAGADGTGWGEGVGVVLVERQSVARAEGHRILAVLRGSAVNQDGASNGLTAPNGPSQQRVIRAALASGGLATADVDVVEGHGTGTSLGDPIEAQALLSTYGQDRETPLYLGSFKSNVGHTQAAAGVGGVIKMIEAMRHGVLPPTLHVDEPSPRVDWADGAVQLITTARDWPAVDRPRRAGVSSFGISGTNAHVIVEAPEPVEVPATEDAPVTSWILSARSAASLAGQLDLVRTATGTAGEVARTLAGRAALEHRVAVAGTDRDELLAALDLAVATRARNGGLAVVFTGQGSQRPGMGRELYATYPVYRYAFDAVCAAFASHLDTDLHDVVFGAVDGRLDRTEFTQPALFATETALYRLAESFGVRPGVLAGHSIGEITAAHVAGVLSLDDAARLVAARGRLMGALPAGGAMLAVAASEAEIDLADGVDVAAVNAPNSTVLAGSVAAIEDAERALTAAGVRSKRLTVSHAFHSALMEPMLAEFAEAIAGISFAPPTVPVVGGDHTSVDYWVQHVRNAVRWTDTVAALADAGAATVLELGPGVVLTPLTAETDPELTAVACADRRRSEPVAFVAALGQVWAAGHRVDLTPAIGTGPRADLPPYAFDHTHYWMLSGPDVGDVTAAGQLASAHPLLAAVVEGPDSVVHTGCLGLATAPWLTDHRVDGVAVLPGTAVLDLVEHAAGGPIAELVLESPLELPETGTVDLRVGRVDDVITVHTRGDDGWTRHARATVGAAVAPAAAGRPSDVDPVDTTGRYERMADAGLAYGPAFATLHDAALSGTDVHARVALPDGTPADGHGVHPALLDAALHAIGLEATAADEKAELPFAFEGFTVHRREAVRASVRVTADGRVDLFDDDGPIATIASVVLRPVSRTVRDLYAVEWVPAQADVLDDVELVELPAGSAATPEAVDAVCTATLALLHERLDGSRRVAFVTRGGVAVHADEPLDLAAAAARGLVKAAAAENPGRFLLVDAVGVPVVVDEPESAVRDGAVFVPRLVRAEAAPAELTSPVLVTGGTGGLGAEFARHLARTGVTELVLTSRRGPATPGVPELVAELAALGAAAHVEVCDMSDRGQVTALLQRRPVRSVVHAAGVLDDVTVAAMRPDQLAAVRAPKLDAALLLDELAGDLDAFVVFSSVAGTLDASAQGNYAAANLALEAFAHERRRRGVPATALAWGLWGEVGMAAGLDDMALARVARSGVRPLTTAEGLALFDAAAGGTNVVPFGLEPAAVRALPEIPHLLRTLVRPPAVAVASARPAVSASSDGLVERLALLAPEERLPYVLETARATVAAVLGHADPAAIDVGRGFGDMGFDSLASIELRNRLNSMSGLTLPATVTFDYPTIQAMAAHLEEQLAPTDELAGSLDRLEELVRTTSADAGERGRLAARLQALAAALATAAEDEHSDVESASADELFDLLDAEFESH